MSIDEIFELSTEQLESMKIEELIVCVRTINSVVPFQKAQINQDGVILLDPNNLNDREWYENDKDYDII